MSAPAPWVEALGAKLFKHGAGEVDTATELAGAEYLLCYHSASWCGPCKAFTPELAAFFSAHAERLKFKVVLISADRSDADMKAYLSHMPWGLAVPFEGPRRKLGSDHGVRGIPALVVLGADGKIITKDGREKVDEDPEGASFPWSPPSAEDALAVLAAGSFMDKAKTAYTWSEHFATKPYVMLYFSAHWCPPCRGFTPALASWYSARCAAGKALADQVDIIFVSSDRDQASFDGYLGEMPWKALEFDDRAGKALLSQVCGVEGIPTLVLMKTATGEIVTDDGRTAVTEEPDAFPWPAKPRVSLSKAAGSFINDLPVAVMFTDKVTDAAAEVAAVTAFDEVAAEHFADGKPSSRIRFAVAADGDGAIDSVRRFLGRAHAGDKDGAEHVRLTIIDVPNGRKALFDGGALKVPSKDEIAAFVAAFLAGAAPTVPIKE